MRDSVNKNDACLLQAMHLYNEIYIEEIIDGGGFTIGKDTLTLRVNRMAWGLFEATLLKAIKERHDLRKRNPELFKDEAVCIHCEGVGHFLYTPGTPEYNECYDSFYVHDGRPSTNAPPRGEPKLSRHCSPCQGTGLKLKE